MERIVIVGASLAGVRAAETLRREGFGGELTIVGRESHYPPHDRPPLSKEILSGEWDLDRGRLRVEDIDARLRLGVSAAALDLGVRAVELSDGSEAPFDGLLIATGAMPRMIPIPGTSLDGVHVLRTFEDAVALRAALEQGPRVTVIGGGFIGVEVAAACRARGLDVTLVENLSAPLLRAIGPELGEWAADLHRRSGVDLRLGVGVAGVLGGGAVTGAALADGTEVPADVVVVAVGVAPETGWLEGSGIELDDGVVCDATCHALGAPDVVAAGDVCRWRNPLFDRVMRIEHWANAVEQGEAAARSLLKGPERAEPFASVPYFWSNQYGTKLQYVGVGGTFAGAVEGEVGDERFVAAFEDEGRLVGALCVNAAARVVKYRRLIGEGATVASLSEGS